jgi:hypothetical protein
MIGAESHQTMAKSFGSFKRKREVENNGEEYIQNFWKFVKIDVETLIKKMDVSHPNRWEALDEVVKYLTDIQQMRDSFKRRAEEISEEE